MELKKLEQKWQDLKMDYDRSELLLEKAREEMSESSTDFIKPVSLKDTLNQQIIEQENIYTKLRNVLIFNLQTTKVSKLINN